MPTRAIPNQRLLFLTGKGGTGRTIFAAALGLQLARQGERTLLLELDENATVGTVFGKPDLDTTPVELARGLFAARLQGLPAMRIFLQRFVPSRRVADLLLRNRVAMTLFESAPGVFDTVMLDRVAAHAEETQWDRIIVDLPATGHARTLLQLPSAMADAFGTGQLAQHVRRLGDIIADPEASALIVITLAEEMPVTETLEFVESLQQRLRIRLGLVVANAVRRVALGSASLREIDEAVRDVSDAAPARSSRIRLGVSLARYWSEEDVAGVERLRSHFGEGEVVELPFIYDRRSDRDLIDQVADHLAAIALPGGVS